MKGLIAVGIVAVLLVGGGLWFGAAMEHGLRCFPGRVANLGAGGGWEDPGLYRSIRANPAALGLRSPPPGLPFNASLLPAQEQGDARLSYVSWNSPDNVTVSLARRDGEDKVFARALYADHGNVPEALRRFLANVSTLGPDARQDLVDSIVPELLPGNVTSLKWNGTLPLQIDVLLQQQYDVGHDWHFEFRGPELFTYREEGFAFHVTPSGDAYASWDTTADAPRSEEDFRRATSAVFTSVGLAAPTFEGLRFREPHEECQA